MPQQMLAVDAWAGPHLLLEASRLSRNLPNGWEKADTREVHVQSHGKGLLSSGKVGRPVCLELRA